LLDSPYKYLNYYELSDKDIFFGRESEILTLLADIVVSRLVVLFAKTGTGKTSLINAGVRPRLEERDYKTFMVQVRQDPVESLRKELGLPNPPSESLMDELEYLSKEVYKKPLVLFFDQFEEFFTYIKADSDAGLKFISDIADIYENQDSGVHIVFSMREEWFYELDAFRDKIPAIFHNESNLRLRWFDESQAREAIKRPAEQFGVTIDDELVDKLIADLSDNGMVEPAQLQIICDALWREREHGQIKLSHYQKSGWQGGEVNIARQILYRRLENEFEKIETEEQLRLLNRLLPQLRTPPPRSIKYVRDIVGLVKDLETDEESLQDLIQHLESSQLIRTSVRDALPVIELLHDYLVEYLDKLAIRVRVVWPRRILRAGLEAYKRDGELLLPDDVVKVSEYLRDEDVKKLTLGDAEAELLFRSALEYGIDMHVWFNLTSKYDVRTWAILKEILRAGSGTGVGDESLVRASNAIYLLAQMLVDVSQALSAFELLREALKQPVLAATVIKNLERYETPLAVELLRTALQYVTISSQAREVLKRFAASKRSQALASLAQKVLSQSKLKGEIETQEETLGRTEDKEAETEKRPLDASPLSTHFKVVSHSLMNGQVVLLLGNGVNLAGRSEEWIIGESLPSKLELASHLSRLYYYPQDEVIELAKVAQYVKVIHGLGPLYDSLSNIFDSDYSPNLIHQFCASLPARLREKNLPHSSYPLRRRLILITTNYDRVMESAFERAGEPYHVLSYIAVADDYEMVGKFLHYSPDKRMTVILETHYTGLEQDSYPVIIKMYGSIPLTLSPDRDDPEYRYPNFVISEDDHVQYSRRADLSLSLPIVIRAILKNSGYLVLGHGVRHWHERALIYGLCGAGNLSWQSWVVNFSTNMLETRWLASQNMEVIDASLEEYINRLAMYI
jgi:hypothetical protein